MAFFCVYAKNFFFANFCASFANEAEQLLCNIPHHTQQVLRKNPKLCKTINEFASQFKKYLWLFNKLKKKNLIKYL